MLKRTADGRQVTMAMNGAATATRAGNTCVKRPIERMTMFYFGEESMKAETRLEVTVTLKEDADNEE